MKKGITMRRELICLLLAVLLAAFAGAASVRAEDDATSGAAEIGGWDASTSGSPDVVTEYRPNEGGVAVDLEVWTEQEWGALKLEAAALGDEDYDLGLDFDVDRSVRSTTAVTALLHRLVHESLEHFQAATNHGRVTRETDFAPEQVYEIDYRLLEHRTEVQPRSASALTLAFGFRRQEREGLQQATTISHCDACHVVSQNRPIDETTDDAVLELDIAFDKGRVGASFVSRDLSTDPTAISLLFDDALHPELRLPLFDNRLQFDSAEGPQPVDSRPDVSKEIYRVDGDLMDVGGFMLSAEGVWSRTENEATGLEADYTGYLVRAVRDLKQNWRLSWSGRSYTLDNDDVFVDSVERLGVAGPQAGRTYREIYGFDPDFLRLSTLDRDVLESDLELSRRWGRKGGTTRFYWEYEDVDREHFMVAPGRTDSATNVFGVSWWARPKKGWKTQVQVEHGDTDDPFLALDGQFSTLTSSPAPNPFHPDAAQYFEFHDARIGDGAASPASWDEVQLRASYTGGSTMISGGYRWWDGDNQEGDLTDWARNVQALNVTVWSAPRPTWEWQLAYSGTESELDAPGSIPLFDG